MELTKENVETATVVLLQAQGKEIGQFLSHGNGDVFLQNGIKGLGEVFILETLSNNRVALKCISKESGLYLSHAFDKLWLQNGIQGEGEEWEMVVHWIFRSKLYTRFRCKLNM
ncbi:MAG: hypothetical protein WCJ72_13855, partial [Chryseobacterium sp.]